MSDRIAVFVRGRIRQTFIGESIRFRGKAGQYNDSAVWVTLAAGGDIGATPVHVYGAGSMVEVIVRPERIVLGEAASACANCFRGRVADVIHHGDHLRVRLNACSSALCLKISCEPSVRSMTALGHSGKPEQFAQRVGSAPDSGSQISGRFAPLGRRNELRQADDCLGDGLSFGPRDGIGQSGERTSLNGVDIREVGAMRIGNTIPAAGIYPLFGR
jgi:hypothetical protein